MMDCTSFKLPEFYNSTSCWIPLTFNPINQNFNLLLQKFLSVHKSSQLSY